MCDELDLANDESSISTHALHRTVSRGLAATFLRGGVRDDRPMQDGMAGCCATVFYLAASAIAASIEFIPATPDFALLTRID